MEVGIASTLLFVYPIMVALIMALVFKEKLTLQTVFCIYWHYQVSVCSIKAVMAQHSVSPVFCWLWLQLLSYAIYIIGVNQSTLKNVATLPLTFYILLFRRIILFFVRVGFGKDLYIVAKWYLWGNLIALAVFPTAISFLCTTSAVQYIGSTPTAILGALEPGHSCIFRGCRVRRNLDTKDRLRDIINYSRRDNHHCGQQHHESFDPF